MLKNTVGLLAAVLVVVACTLAQPADSSRLPTNVTTGLNPHSAEEQIALPFDRFPDFGYMVAPQEYDATYGDIPIFKLSQDYPKALPAESELPSMLKIDFRKDWKAYAMSVRDYCFEGNIGASKIEDDWRPENNSVRDWYHIPWLHWGPKGTEGFHGLIFETSVAPFQLAAGQTDTHDIYAITLINNFAGYTLGQMWAEPFNPNPEVTDRRKGGGFPVGAVFCKLLMTTAPVEEVDYLINPLEWHAYTLKDANDPGAGREVSTVRLLQMDWMVRDPRADGTTGWVLGTFVYNGHLGQKSPWYNLVPLGVQWGNDPKVTENKITPYPATKTTINSALKETIINDSADLPPMHLGWNGRLNGPADLNTSSCMACHAVGEYPQVRSLVAPGMIPGRGQQPPYLAPSQGGSTEWMGWFQNVKAATAVDPNDANSTDFSLQIGISLTNFYDWANQEIGGEWAEEYETVRYPIQRGP